MTITIAAQTSRAEKLYEDGLRLKTTFTISAQNAAIQKFQQAKVAFASTIRKTTCEQQIAACNINIKRIKEKERDKPKPNSEKAERHNRDVKMEVFVADSKGEATIDDIEIWPNQNVRGDIGLMIQMRLEVKGLKDKPCKVIVAFNDEFGRPLKDQNQKYAAAGNVVTDEIITPLYNGSLWKDFKLAIPYSELHLIGSGMKKIQLCIGIFDVSESRVKQLLVVPPIETSFYYDDTFITVNGVQDEITEFYSEKGGRTTFNVSTNAGRYELVEFPKWCAVEDQSQTRFTLVCPPNEGTIPRNDNFEVAASARKHVRINIVQKAAEGASATINKVWAERDCLYFTTRGLRIHIDVKVNGMMNQEVYYQVNFYQGDNKTPLLDAMGEAITYKAREFSEFDETRWSDWYVFLPNHKVYGASNSNGTFTFDCMILDSSGKVLSISRNNSLSLP